MSAELAIDASGWMVGLRAADQSTFFEQVAQRRELLRATLRCVVWIVLASAVYGFTFGLWRNEWLALYVAAKLPALLIATSLAVMTLNWMLGQLMGSGLGLSQVAALTWRAMAVACLILLAVSPVSLALAVTCPPPSTPSNLPHNTLMLYHIFLVGVSGLFGNAVMMQGLRRLTAPTCRVRLLYAVWIATHVFVGCQLSWILRPFLGSPHYPVVFLRPNALEGNFYEFVYGIIVYGLLRGG